jgi:hypothetical protein
VNGNNYVTLATVSTERARIDNSGRLLVGTASLRVLGTTGYVPQILLEGLGGGASTIGAIRNSDNANGPSLTLGKSRSSTVGGSTIVENNDVLADLNFHGADGTALIQAARISAQVDGDPDPNNDGQAENGMPGRLVFSTTLAGASSPTERMRLDNTGNLTIASNFSTTDFGLCHTNGFFRSHRSSGVSVCFNGQLSGSSTSTITAAGDATFNGALSKGSGSFKISHPLPEKTDTHYLYHSFIEGPQADLIYRGHVQLVNGTASVNIDEAARMTEGTFEALCTNVCCFTSNESDWTAVRGSVSGNILTIEAQDPASTADICWMVVGERKDQHMLDTGWTDANGRVITERLKSEVDSPVEE